jgi:hypothetical protein
MLEVASRIHSDSGGVSASQALVTSLCSGAILLTGECEEGRPRKSFKDLLLGLTAGSRKDSGVENYWPIRSLVGEHPPALWSHAHPPVSPRYEQNHACGRPIIDLELMLFSHCL